jgi:hypothetical protein
MHEENFYVYQRRALRPLLIWGVGSTIVGTLLTPLAGFWRQFGLQAAAWGAIDAALAIAGRRRALVRAEALAAHSLDDDEVARDAEQFRRVLLVNAGLDVLYILSGLFTARRFRDRPDRVGLGVGIAVQGLFLLIFDALLARKIGERYTDA